MEEESQQKELFQFQKPKRSFSGFSRFFPKADFEGRVLVTLTPEQIILIAIGILLCLVVIYAVGVEQGKRNLVDRPAAVVPSEKQQSVPEQSFFATTQVASQPVKAKSSSGAALLRKPQVSAESDYKSKPYTIAVAALKSRESAAQIVKRLRQEGFSAFLMEKSPYVVVCVGEYSDRNDAQALRDLSKIRQKYRDAYLKAR